MKLTKQNAAMHVRVLLIAEDKILTELSRHRAIIDMRIFINRYMEMLYPNEGDPVPDKVKRFVETFILNDKRRLTKEAKQCLQELEDGPVTNYRDIECGLPDLYKDLSEDGYTELSVPGTGYAVVGPSPLRCKVALFLVFAQRQIRVKEPSTYLSERIKYFGRTLSDKPKSSFRNGVVTTTREAEWNMKYALRDEKEEGEETRV